MDLATLLKNNYNELNTIARRITRRQNSSLAPELINETYIELCRKNCQPPKDNSQFVKWYSKCMHNYFQWPNSSFNKSIRLNSNNIDLDFNIQDDEQVLEMEIFQSNHATKEFIRVSSSMRTDRALKYIQVLEFKKSLSLHEQELFDLHFVNGLSGRQITERLNMVSGTNTHKREITNMLNSIKTKIKQTKWQ